jgi:hypothetical protein
MGAQYIIMYVIVAVCIVFAVRMLYHKIRAANGKENPCANCNNSDCALRDIKNTKCNNRKHKKYSCCD